MTATTEPATRAKQPRLTRVKATAASVAKVEARLAAAKEKRDAAIAEAFGQGVGTRQIAAVSGLSNSGVRKIVGIDGPR